VGDVSLDFTGEWSGDATATVRMGLGSLTLVVPADLGVRIHKSGFLASLDATGFEKVEDAWQTANWGSARSHLDIDLKAALGSIEVDIEL
jgi:predicted membrane protein